MPTDHSRDVERNIVSEDVRAAHHDFLQAMPKLGLTPSHNSGHVRSVRLHDIESRYLFSWIPAQHHLLFYIRKPALDAAPHLRVAAGKQLSGVNQNPAGEITVRIESREGAQVLLRWLETVLPLPS